MPENHPQGTASRRLLLWVDGVGTYLILTSDRVSVGRAGASSHPDIALAADIAGYHADIVRVEDDYFLLAPREPAKVDGAAVERKLLASGNVIELGPRCQMTFQLPTAMSATAVLSLHRGQRIEGDARKIILLKEHLVIGSKGKCHVETASQGENVVLSLEPRGLVCRARDEIQVGGKPAGREVILPLGLQIQAGDVSFTVTESQGGRV